MELSVMSTGGATSQLTSFYQGRSESSLDEVMKNSSTGSTTTNHYHMSVGLVSSHTYKVLQAYYQ
jgi:hypothetical protein